MDDLPPDHFLDARLSCSGGADVVCGAGTEATRSTSRATLLLRRMEPAISTRVTPGSFTGRRSDGFGGSQRMDQLS
jgi:hypothetical protein